MRVCRSEAERRVRLLVAVAPVAGGVPDVLLELRSRFAVRRVHAEYDLRRLVNVGDVLGEQPIGVGKELITGESVVRQRKITVSVLDGVHTS